MRREFHRQMVAEDGRQTRPHSTAKIVSFFQPPSPWLFCFHLPPITTHTSTADIFRHHPRRQHRHTGAG
ncbi:hypothetical protein OF83DRAFT_896597 [Amylostereum chailletii]|nr:hypothetical protein OF83DRAFT_896597 [Amylostereum chailletii]